MATTITPFQASIATKMAASSAKSLMEFFQPAKRLKSVSSSSPETLTLKSSISSICKVSSSGNANGIQADSLPAPPPEQRIQAGSPPAFSPEQSIQSDSPPALSSEQRKRMEINKCLARSKRNIRMCLERIEKAKDEGVDCVKLEHLLVEETWLDAVSGEFQKPYMRNLCRFVEQEMRGREPIYPAKHLIFNALNSTPFDRVKVVIIGQDPYHGPGQAMGLAFSVPEGIKIPSSLVNIFKELKHDLGCSIPSHGNLEKWAIQGVLLLNTVLTVRNHQANSHAKKGWEPFTDAIIRTISQKRYGIIFLLWGNSAHEKSRLIDGTKHHILKAAHPSGLSANRGFFGCRHFSQANQKLEEQELVPIDWQL